MKKIILFFTFFLYSSLSHSQLALEGFESTTGPDIASTNWTLGTGNWAVFDNGIGLGQRWGINTTTVCIGLQTAYMNREFIGQGNTSEDYLSTPLVTIPTNGELHFQTRTFTNNNQGTIFQIKVAPATASQTNPAAYTMVQQWDETTLTAVYNICEDKIVDLSAYAGQQIYVSFVQIFTQPTASLGGDRWLVDNVSVNEQCLIPTGLTATGITANSMNLNWANPSGATSWEIEFIPAGNTPTGVGVVYNGTLPYSVTGLLPNTLYKYYVRALCNTGYSSLWSTVSSTFSTTTAPPVCGGNFVDVAGPTANYADNSDSTVTICPVVAGDLVTVNFTTFNTEATYDALYVFNGNSIASPQIASANPAGNVPGALAGGYWGTTIPGPFTSSSPDGCLTFRFRSDFIFTLSGWIANVTCAPPPTCLQPTALVSSTITANSVTLGWTNNGVATAWQVLALPCGSPAPTSGSTGWIDAPTNPFTITGLNSYTCYSLYVRGVCSPTDSSFWSGPRNITTLIAPPICGGNYVDSGGTSANYANNANLTTTICPVNTGDAVTITFASFNIQANFDFLRIYNGSDATAPLIATLTGTALPPSFTSSASNGCLTFVFTSNATVTSTGWLANLSCSPAPTCPKPVLLTATNITSSSVTFGWTSTGTETAWQVIALPCTAPAPNATTTGWTDAPTNPFNLTIGLAASACFNLYVRAICASTDVSNWSAPLSITTPIAPPICGGIFVDNAGPNGNYANNSNSTVTICPTNIGDLVTVTFTAFNTEVNWDALYVFDGNSITAAQLASTNPAGTVPGGLAGGYWGTTIPGPFTSSSPTGCLTFRFRSDGVNNQSGWLANITCTPAPTCPRPTAIVVSGFTQTETTFAWTEVGTATTWEVLVLPQGSPLPNASSVGVITTNNPYTATGLSSGTLYTAYIRSICSSTDSSNWTFGTNFYTLISNDECTGAIPVTVNPNVFCTQVTSGTLLGATASSQTNACGGSDDDDVWFSFVAVTTSHTINLNNIAGSTTGLYHVVYTGSCGTLTQVSCNTNTASTTNNLVVGQTYYIRVYSSTATPNQNSTFNVCVGTVPPPIATNTTQYTTQQLIQDILLNTTCASVTNITSSTGTDFSSTNGIGYFSENASGFPFSDGIVLSTGNAANAQGPNNSILSEGATTWTGDAQLEAIILAATGTPMASRNATKLEFDFIPLVNNISFNFLFASEEYGTFQCGFSDSFAFLLTNISTGVTTNLAVIPNTTTPISVVTIRNNLFNAGCDSANPQYFGNFYGANPGLNILASPTNFNGITVPLTATSPVIAGNQYHIKLVIADQSDSLYDSAVFLEGGSLDIGNVELGNDFLLSTGNALCSGSSYTILSGLDPANYTFSWTFNGAPIANETAANLTITEQGIYAIAAQYTNTTCAATDTITIEYYPTITVGTPNNLIACNNTGFAEFDLTQNDALALNGLDATQHTVSYYLTNANASAEINPLPSLYTNAVQNLQTVYVRLENNVSGCFATNPFSLIVNPLVVPTFTIVDAVCENSVPFTLPTTSENNIVGVWSPDSVIVTTETVYTFTPNVGTCGDVITKTIAISPTITPVTSFSYTTPVCKNGINPTPIPSTGLTTGGTYSYAETSGLGLDATTGIIDLANSTPGTYTVTYAVAANPSTCQVTHSDPFVITIAPIITPVTTFSYTSPICPGGTNPFPNTSTAGFTTGGTYSSTTGLDIDGTTGEIATTTSTPGTYTITYTVTANSAICQVVNSGIAVLVISNPIEVSISGDCVGVNYVLTANPIASSFNPTTATYAWTDSAQNPIGGNTQSITVTEDGQYSITVVSDGCNGSASFIPDSVTCVIQKGISVNETPDGLNDCLDLQGYNVEKLTIFNRYGMKVFNKNNYTNQWCGQSENGDKLPDGTYYYVIERTNGESKTGWVYINKE